MFTTLQKWVLISILVLPVVSFGAQWKTQDGQPKWPDPDWLETSLKETGKKLDVVKDLSQPGPDIESLYSKASDLFKQASDVFKRSNQERGNFFRCARLINATNALLDAAYGIYSSRKADRTPQDFWGVGMVLPAFYFRIQQAGFFASKSGEKNSEQYVMLARSIYQQARSAYEAHEYQKAKYLADASMSIVAALESISHAATSFSQNPGNPQTNK